MLEEKSIESDKKGGKNKVALLAVMMIIIIVLLGIIIHLVARNQELKTTQEIVEEEASEETTSEETTQRAVLMTQQNAEEIIEQMETVENVPVGYYTATMNNVWHFETWDHASTDAYVSNVPGNTNDVYFDVFLANGEDEEAIYASPVIPRGAELNDITLDRELPAGTYDCVLIYHLIDEKQNTVSTLRVAITVIIEN